MSIDVTDDQLVVLRIDGMHCHKCELAIKSSLLKYSGVHEVEVDFNSGQASVLFNRDVVAIRQLIDAVNAAGYSATGFAQGQAQTR